MSEKISIPDERYFIHCQRCLSRSNLMMVPHRRDGKMLGWIFVCQNCLDNVLNAEVAITYKISGDSAKMISEGEKQ